MMTKIDDIDHFCWTKLAYGSNDFVHLWAQIAVKLDFLDTDLYLNLWHASMLRPSVELCCWGNAALSYYQLLFVVKSARDVEENICLWFCVSCADLHIRILEVCCRVLLLSFQSTK